MRWIVLLHVWLSALLAVQQPGVLVRAERGGQARTGADTRGTAQAPWDEDEDELPAVSSAEVPGVRAPRALLPEPVALESWTWREREPQRPLAPSRGDSARGHWRAAQLPPWVPLEDEPPARG